MRGKCERGRGSANADGAGAKVFAGDGCSQGRLSAPWPRFHGVDRADVYIIIHVRACCCGECALNPPPSQFTPRRRLPLAPAQRHALPEHFCSPTQPRRTPTQRRRTPAALTTHFPSKTCSRLRSDAPCPSIFSPPSRTLPLPSQRRCTPADPTTHSSPKSCSRPRTATRPAPALLPHPRSPDARPPTSRPIPRRRPSPTPAQRHALPEHFRSPTQPRRTPAGCAMHARRPHDTFPVEDLRPPTSQHIPRRRSPPLPLRSASDTKKRHRTVDVRCRMSRSTVVAVGHWGW